MAVWTPTSQVEATPAGGGRYPQVARAAVQSPTAAAFYGNDEQGSYSFSVRWRQTHPRLDRASVAGAVAVAPGKPGTEW